MTARIASSNAASNAIGSAINAVAPLSGSSYKTRDIRGLSLHTTSHQVSGVPRLFRRAAAVACVGALIWSGWNIVMPSHAQSATGPVEVVTYSVRPGDTLWSYAREATPQGGDVSDTVSRLMKLNNLDSAALQPGQTILVPIQQ